MPLRYRRGGYHSLYCTHLASFLSSIPPVRRFFGVAAAVVLLDQLVKVVVKLTLPLGGEQNLLGSLFRIHFTENKGAAFGMTLQNFMPFLTDEVAKVILTVFSLVAVGFIGWYLLRVARSGKPGLALCIALILGGALGNIIDRTFYGVIFQSINDYEGGLLHGRVVDMFFLDIYQGILPQDWPLVGGMRLFLWPIFNIADMAISTGIVAILVFQKRFFEEKKETEAAPAPAAPAEDSPAA